MILQGACIASTLPYEVAETGTQSDSLSTNQSRLSCVCSNGCPVCCTKALQPCLVTLLESFLLILSGVDMCHLCQNISRSRNQLDNHISNNHNMSLDILGGFWSWLSYSSPYLQECFLFAALIRDGNI